MGAVYNEGIRTLPVLSGADIREYLLVNFDTDGTVTPYVQGSGKILMGSTEASSENDVVAVRLCNVAGTRYLKVDNSQAVTVGGWFTNGATAGTIKPVTGDEPILGFTLEAATSGATTFAIVECVLLSGLAFVGGPTADGELPNFPVGPLVPAT